MMRDASLLGSGSNLNVTLNSRSFLNELSFTPFDVLDLL